MPIYVGYTQKRRTVALLGAGKNQLFLCSPDVPINLTATLNDYTNIRNYTFDAVAGDGGEEATAEQIEITAAYEDLDGSRYIRSKRGSDSRWWSID